jgi:S-DNA-T family DNA segregation ATPase FtsK/SpoIIIE
VPKEEQGSLAVEGALLIMVGEAAAAVLHKPAWRLLAAAGAGVMIQGLLDPYKLLKALFYGAGLTAKAQDGRTVFPRVIEEKPLPSGKELTLSLPLGLSGDDFERKELVLSHGLNAHVETEYQNGRIIMRVNEAGLRSKYAFHQMDLPGAVEIPIGHSRQGFISLAFSDQVSALLVGGVPGSGKSVFLRQCLANLILAKDPSQLRLYLIDLKNGVEFAAFQNSRLVAGFAADERQALGVVSDLEQEMLARYRTLREAACVNITEYLAKGGTMDYILCLCDEYANLREFAEIQSKFDRLLRMSRAVGMYYILATQRPSSETLPGIIKSNVQATLAFACRNEVTSRILLDEGGAEEIEIQGRAIYQTKKNQEVQVMYLSDEECRKLIAPMNQPRRERQRDTSGVTRRHADSPRPPSDQLPARVQGGRRSTVAKTVLPRSP